MNDLSDMAVFVTQVADTEVVVCYTRSTKQIVAIETTDGERRPIHIASEEREKLTKLLP